MIPADIVQCNEFPTTPNGKIDTRKLLSGYIMSLTDNQKLPLPDKYGPDIITLTATEKIIYNIWCEDLKTKRIAPTDNFFEVGGNSLMAISVFSKIEAEFSLDLGLRVFFESPRIKDLGEVIDFELNRRAGRYKAPDTKDQEDLRIVKGEI
jgi:acyl carrier protein